MNGKRSQWDTLTDGGGFSFFLLTVDKQTILITTCSARGSEEQIVKCVELLLSRNADPNVACR